MSKVCQKFVKKILLSISVYNKSKVSPFHPPFLAHLDYSRADIAAKARQWPMKL